MAVDDVRPERPGLGHEPGRERPQGRRRAARPVVGANHPLGQASDLLAMLLGDYEAQVLRTEYRELMG